LFWQRVGDHREQTEIGGAGRNVAHGVELGQIAAQVLVEVDVGGRSERLWQCIEAHDRADQSGRRCHVVVGIPACEACNVDGCSQVPIAIEQGHDRGGEVEPAGPPFGIVVVRQSDVLASDPPVVGGLVVPPQHRVHDGSHDRVGGFVGPGMGDDLGNIGLTECHGIHVGVERAGVDGRPTAGDLRKEASLLPSATRLPRIYEPEQLGFELGIHGPRPLGIARKAARRRWQYALVHQVPSAPRRHPDVAVQMVDPLVADLCVGRVESVGLQDVQIEPFDVGVVVGRPLIEQHQINDVAGSGFVEPDAFDGKA